MLVWVWVWVLVLVFVLCWGLNARKCSNHGFCLHCCFFQDDTGRVTFTYDVGVTQYGSPDFDSWTYSRWSSIGTRLVVDERPFTHTGAMMDSSVRDLMTLWPKCFIAVD